MTATGPATSPLRNERLRGAPSVTGRLVGSILAAVLAGPAAAAGTAKPGASPAVRARIAALVLRRTEFGAISLLPVRFEASRLAGPFEDGGRTTYCVTARMLGRSFGRGERARALVREESGALRAEGYDAEVCEGHRSETFPELDAAR